MVLVKNCLPILTSLVGILIAAMVLSCNGNGGAADSGGSVYPLVGGTTSGSSQGTPESAGGEQISSDIRSSDILELSNSDDIEGIISIFRVSIWKRRRHDGPADRHHECRCHRPALGWLCYADNQRERGELHGDGQGGR